MLTPEENIRLTETGPETAAGKVLRSYWQPVALTEELDGERPVKAVTLMNEQLVLFKAADGEYRLSGRFCPHRGVDLSYGRLEADGLRCPFHGWLFDGKGHCLEQPAQPAGSNTHTLVKHPSYPCEERNGVIFAYLGDGEPPVFPALDCFTAPDSHVFAYKGLWYCNWLQALEVGIDPVHASFLHRFLADDSLDEAYGRQFRDEAADSSMPLTKVLREFDCPEIRAEETDFGIRLLTLREISEESTHVRVTNLLFPNAIVIPMSNEMVIAQWHVPVDDESCYWYSMFISFGKPVNKELMRAQRIDMNPPPDYKPKYGPQNQWGYNPDEQRDKTYTGMGDDINVHDQWAVESPGPIADRSKHQLMRSDIGIMRYRRMLFKAMDAAEADSRNALPMSSDVTRIRGPVAIDEIGPADDWQNCWKERDLKRRQQSGWADDPWQE